MDILVCAATSIELRACRAGLKTFRGTFDFLKTGVGFVNAKKSLERKLKTGPKPKLIVSSGYAGALSAEVPMGSWVTARKIYIKSDFQNNAIDALLLTNLVSEVRGAMACSLVSTNQLIHQRETDTDFKLFKQVPSPIVVDMESGVLAEIAEQNEIAFMVLRYITDTPQSPLPRFTANIATAMAAEKSLVRVSQSFQGARQAILDPIGVVGVIQNNRKWTNAMQSGWQNHAQNVLQLLTR